MHYLAFLFEALLGFFWQRMAVRQAAIPVRRHDRRDAPNRAAPLGRAPGFGWMNVASVYEPRREPPRWGESPGAWDDRSTRSGG